MDKLRNDIISLNNRKNEYANKKVNGQVSDTEERELLSRIVYLISELRNFAFNLGVKENGNFEPNFTNDEEKKDWEEKMIALSHLNNLTKELKNQILILRNNTPIELLDIMKKGKDDLLKQQKPPPKKDSRKDEIKKRLQSKLSSS